MPKNNRLPLVTQYNSDKFFEKLKNKDEDCYKEFIKLILQYKDEEINIETLANKTEEILNKYPELLEEAMLFIDYKKLNTINYKKNLISKNNTNNNSKEKNINVNENQNVMENNQSNSKKENKTQNKNLSSTINKEKNQTNDYSFPYFAPKIQMSPEYLFFNGLKEIFPPEIYQIIIKILYLYVEGIISQYEFTVLITLIF